MARVENGGACAGQGQGRAACGKHDTGAWLGGVMSAGTSGACCALQFGYFSFGDNDLLALFAMFFGKSQATWVRMCRRLGKTSFLHS